VEPALTIAPKDWMTAPPTRAVMDALRADGNEARFVGGCVRDTMMNEVRGMNRPVGDIDIATYEAP